MTPREFFPNMPDQLFEDWLAPLIASKGWPFTSLDDDLVSTKLRYIFGKEHSLREWCTCKWALTEVDVRTLRLSKNSVEMVKGILSHSVFEQSSPTSKVKNSKERFEACSDYIKSHGAIPKPVVLKPFEDGYTLMDGHHRLAAFTYLHPPHSIVPAWVANFS